MIGYSTRAQSTAQPNPIPPTPENKWHEAAQRKRGGHRVGLVPCPVLTRVFAAVPLPPQDGWEGSAASKKHCRHTSDTSDTAPTSASKAPPPIAIPSRRPLRPPARAGVPAPPCSHPRSSSEAGPAAIPRPRPANPGCQTLFAAWADKRASIRTTKWSRRYFVLRTRSLADVKAAGSMFKSTPGDSRFKQASHALLYFSSPAHCRAVLHDGKGVPSGAIPITLGTTAVVEVQDARTTAGGALAGTGRQCLKISTEGIVRSYFLIPDGAAAHWVNVLTKPGGTPPELASPGRQNFQAIPGDSVEDHAEDHDNGADSCSDPELAMPAMDEDWREECESLRRILLSRRCRAPARVPTDEGMSVLSAMVLRGLDLRGQVLVLLDRHKDMTLSAVTRSLHPGSDTDHSLRKLLPHIQNRYRVEVGQDLGMTGIVTATQDPLLFGNIPQQQLCDFAATFREQFSIVLFVQALVRDINRQGIFYSLNRA